MRRRFPYLCMLLAGLTLAACSQIPGVTPPGKGGNNTNNDGEITYKIITSAIPPRAELEHYDEQLLSNIPSTHGGSVEWSIDPDTLPAGLALVDHDLPIARIVGVPELGSREIYPLLVTLILNQTVLDVRTIELEIINGFGLTLNPERTIPPANVSQFYSTTIEVNGGSGTYQWTITGAPDWITIFQLDSVLMLSCDLVPADALGQTFPIDVYVKDDTSPSALDARWVYELYVSNSTNLVVGSFMWPAVLDMPYSGRVPVAGGVPPYHFTFSNPSQPTWLSFNAAQGTVFGTPSSATFDNDDEFSFDVVVTDSNLHGPTSVPASISIGLFSELEVLTTSLPDAREGATYGMWLEAGSTGPGWTLHNQIGWSMIDPGGAPLNLMTVGWLAPKGDGSYTPSPIPYGTTGTHTIRVVASDFLAMGRQADATLTLTILPGVLTLLNETLLSEAIIFEAYELQLEAAGGTAPYESWTADSRIPDWLSLDPVTGMLSGTPDDVGDLGDITFSVSVTDAASTPFTKDFTISVVRPDPLEIDLAVLELDAVVGTSYWGVVMAQGGVSGKTWRVLPVAAGGMGELPSGIVVDPVTGAIKGTPTSAGSYPFTLELNDRLDVPVKEDLTLTVSATVPFGPVVGHLPGFGDMGGGIIEAYPYDPNFGTTGGYFNHAARSWYMGDNGPANIALLARPRALAFDSHGNLYFADDDHYAIRKVSVDASGKLSKYSVITTYCGGQTFAGGSISWKIENGKMVLDPPVKAKDTVLNNISGLAIDGANNLYFVELFTGNVYRIKLSESDPWLELIGGSGLQMPVPCLDVNNKRTGAATQIAVCSDVDPNIAILDPTSGEVVNSLAPDNYVVRSLGYNQNNQLFATSGDFSYGDTYSCYRYNDSTDAFEPHQWAVGAAPGPSTLPLVFDTAGNVVSFDGPHAHGGHAYGTRDRQGVFYFADTDAHTIYRRQE